MRYPWYFCPDCRDRASTRDGRLLVFGNTGFGGGFCFGYRDETPRYVAPGAICLILDRPVYVTEARFGGIVAQPLIDPPRTGKGVVDIRQGIPEGLRTV